MEQDLREQHFLTDECYKTILNTMGEGVVIVDDQHKIRFCNKAILEMLGSQNTQLLGKDFKNLLSCPAEINLHNYDKPHIIDNAACNLIRPDGKELPVLRNIRPLQNKQNEIIAYIETIRDMSTLKRVEQRLALLEKKAKDVIKFHRIVGKSEVMKEVFNLIQLAADSTANVLITGESGTGKELVAEAIHAESKRENRPLIKVNCSSLPESLLESELFGHVKGAFTGAIKDKPGRFELADKGTLFIDEISEVSPLIQLKLLRFLQEREYERVGEGRTRKADVRIISASNKDLKKLYKEGLFREDLYYRLKVFPINLPSLRQRKKDLGLLVDHFIEKFNNQTDKKISGVAEDAMVSLMDYSWPGNVRELENAIEHAFVIRNQGEITLFDLPVEIRQAPLREDGGGRKNRFDDSIGGIVDHATVNVLTPEKLRDLLDKFMWNKSALARYLGVNRTTVWRMMKRLGVTSR